MKGSAIARVLILCVSLSLCPVLTGSRAHSIFQHWIALVEEHHAAIALAIKQRAAAMRATSVPSLPAACIYLFSFTAANQALQMWPRTEGHACGMPSASARAKTFHAFFETMILKNPAFSQGFTGDFSFLLDVIDGHRQSHAARALGVPMLVLSKHPRDNYTLPFPDLYHVLGLLTLQQNSAKGPPRTIAGLDYDWQKGMVEGRALQTLAQAASFQLKSKPWEERRSAAVYRGSCYSTANSSDSSPTVRAFAARAQLARLCTLYRQRWADRPSTPEGRQGNAPGTPATAAPLSTSPAALRPNPAQRPSQATALVGASTGAVKGLLPQAARRDVMLARNRHAADHLSKSRRRQTRARQLTASQMEAAVSHRHAVRRGEATHGSEDGGCNVNCTADLEGSTDSKQGAASQVAAAKASGEGQQLPLLRHKPALTKEQRLERSAGVAAWGAFRKQREEAMEAALEAAQLQPGTLDIGLVIRGYEATCVNNTDAPKLCSACRLCYADSKPLLSMQEMLQYKYQILVDGYSAAWDSSLWKFTSNSTVFYIHPQQHHDSSAHQPWSLWWYPALEPGEHYFSTTATELPLKLAKCLKAEETCRRMAARAREAVQRSVSPEATLEYAFLLLQHVHNMQQL